MDERRRRVYDDLRGMVTGELLFDSMARAPYAFDASIYEIDPLGVVVPQSRADVVAVARYATEKGLSLHARGSGTGYAGESLGRGLVLDFSRHMRRIISLGCDQVVVEPGLILDDLNAQLEPLGRRLGPDPSGSATCTIGGMIAGDAGGMRSMRYGTTSDAVVSLEVVLADGEVMSLACEPWPRADRDPADRKDQIVRRIALYLQWNADLIARSTVRSPRNRAGYALSKIAVPDGLRLPRLMAGSEGTLALFTQCTLRTVPLPGASCVLLLPFGRLLDAAAAVPGCLPLQPSACDLVDWRRLMMAREADPFLRACINETAEAALVIEFEGDDLQELLGRARGLASRCHREGWLVCEEVISSRRSDCDRLLNLRNLITPQLMSAVGPARAVPLVEDIALPPVEIRPFLQQLQNILKRHEVSWTFHAHAGDGQLHVRPFLDLSRPDAGAIIEALAAEVHTAALALGGTVSGEHGCGLTRTQFLREQYGELMDVFREIKYAFDPQGLLNPGKIVGNDPHLIAKDLRGWAPYDEQGQAQQGALPVLSDPLIWQGRGRAEQINACNGCGDCRTRDPALRMCPTFRGLGHEACSPRSKVNVLRQIASGQLDPRHWGSEQFRAMADLCVHCGLCRLECPAGIDISALMIEAKAAYVETHGPTPSDWLLSRLDFWAKWSSRVPFVANLMLGNRQSRWLLERLFGLSRHRVMPRSRRFSFLHRADRMGLTKPRAQQPGPRVAYFVDLFANHFDPELAEAVVAVLRHAGVNVYVPPKQRSSGMHALAAGDIERARDRVVTNLRTLAEAVRDGYTVVCSEPTAAVMLKYESLKLTDDLDAAFVAENTMDVGQYLVGLHQRGGLPDPIESLSARVGYHQPCHLRVQEIGMPGFDLIRRIPGLEVTHIDRGCSGFAGVFGLASRNFRTSLRAGRGLRGRLKQPDIEIGATECGTCRLQMEQGSTKRTLHPMKLLSLAYGLNPELRQQFKQPKSRHEIG